MKRIAFLIYACYLFVNPKMALGCSCVPNLLGIEDQVKIALFRADEVFLGKVTSSSYTGDLVLYSIAVERSWKGKPPGKVVLASLKHGSMCGVSLQQNELYLFYGQLQPEDEYRGYRFTLNTCDRSVVREIEKEKSILDSIDHKSLTNEEIEKLEKAGSSLLNQRQL